MSSTKPLNKKTRVDWKAVGQRIRQLRGFYATQEELARQIGVSQSYLSKMEDGKVAIGSEILLMISRRFGKPLEWILTG